MADKDDEFKKFTVRFRPKLTIMKRSTMDKKFDINIKSHRSHLIRQCLPIATRELMTRNEGIPMVRLKHEVLRYARFKESPFNGLPESLPLKHCRNCNSYSYSGRTAWFQALPNSKELLSFLIEVFMYTVKTRMDLKDAHFVDCDPNSRRIEISLALQAPNGPKQDNFHNVEFLLRYQLCPCCLPWVRWNTVVQLRPPGCNKLQRLHLVRIILRNPLVTLGSQFKTMGQGFDFLFTREKDGIDFLDILSKVCPIKRDKIHKSNTGNSCIPAWICPICSFDLVYLPPKILASLGNLGPIVICTNVSKQITLLDPSNLRTCTLSFDEYWKEPFEYLMTSKEFVKFVVLNVEIVRRGACNILADVEVARVSDFGKNDKTFSVRSHLGKHLIPGDYVLGYDLSRANINNPEMEKQMDLLPDLVLIKKTYTPSFPTRKLTQVKKTSPEYEEFLSNLEKNPEAMFNLSLKSGEDENRASDMVGVKEKVNADLEIEALLADLGLSDEEKDEGTSRK